MATRSEGSRYMAFIFESEEKYMVVIASVDSLFVFACVIMWLILDVHISALPQKRKITLLLLFMAILLVNPLVRMYFGNVVYGKLYLFFIQIPVFILFALASQYKGIKLLFALLTTIVFASPVIIISMALKQFLSPTIEIILAANLISYVAIIALTYRFLKKPFNYMFEHGGNRLFWMFSSIPLLYYLYTYGKTQYNFSGVDSYDYFFLNLLPDATVWASYLLMLYVFKTAQEKDRLREEQSMIAMCLDQSRHQMEKYEASYTQARIYRHDIRHHFTLIDGYLLDGKISEARKYIGDAQSDIFAVTPVCYCLNNTVNLILSSYAAKANTLDIAFRAEANLPQILPMPETELCSILSNGLENAVTAAGAGAHKDKTVFVRCGINKNHLLVHIENPYEGAIEMKNGLPQSHTQGHGFGVQSIALLVKKYNGYCSFSPQDGVFTFQAMLMLEELTAE